MPALINHFFGGDLEGLFGATPFEVLHQLLLGIFKYILESLYNYRTIPDSMLIGNCILHCTTVYDL